MKEDLLKKYFNKNCNKEELEQVWDWFETEAGQVYLEKKIEQERVFAKENKLEIYPDIPTEKIFKRIQGDKPQSERKQWVFMRVAAVLIIAVMLSIVVSWTVNGGFYVEPKIEYTTYSTGQGQQKIITLSDGSIVRLNRNSSLTFPKTFSSEKRAVTLKGEAYFQITSNPENPFIVHAGQGIIRVLGTKFNVQIEPSETKVKVAVVEGRVALRESGPIASSKAILTRNHFGILNISTNQITIEKTKTKNYLSWFTDRLVYNNLSLWKISRQLEHIYNIEIGFEQEFLKKQKLTANFEKASLKETLDVIAKTLGISFVLKKNKVIWTSRKGKKIAS